jgi:hypothetical protein
MTDQDKIELIRREFATFAGWREFSEDYDPNELLLRIAAIVGETDKPEPRRHG